MLQSFGPMIDDWFYSKVAGASHKNADGTFRSRVLSQCEPFELLDFEREPDNPYDAHAVKVLRRETGEQVGYLPSRTAADIMRRIEPGTRWFAVLKNHNISPESDRIVGANIAVMRWNEAMSVAYQEAHRPKSKEERWEVVKRERAERLAGRRD